MGHNDHIDWETHEAIQDLLDEGLIKEGTTAYGIAQQVIHSGYDSLSSKQKFVYDKEVVSTLEARGQEIRMNEIRNSNPD